MIDERCNLRRVVRFETVRILHDNPHRRFLERDLQKLEATDHLFDHINVRVHIFQCSSLHIDHGK